MGRDRVLYGPEIHNPIMFGVGNWRTFGCVVGSGRGNDFSQVDQAIDAGYTVIFIKPGTYNKFTADVANLFIMGSGRGTLINGGTSGHAITASAAGVTICNLAVQTTAGGGNAYDGIAISARVDVQGVTGVASDEYFISISANGDDSKITGCTTLSSDDDGIYIANGGDNCVIVGNRIKGWVNEAIDDDTTGPTTTEAGNDETA